MTSDPVLRVRNLVKHYSSGRRLLRAAAGDVRAVDDVSFDLRRGEALGLVGESGCGKSTVGRAAVRLLSPTSGSILLDGQASASSTSRELAGWRKRVQIVFQDPFASLNPQLSVARNVAEPMRIQRSTKRSRRRERVAELFEQVGLDQQMMSRAPAECSGGQLQRVSIARALATGPSVLVLDEPVSALDVSVQAQILNLLRGLQRAHGLSYLFISHDLSVVRYVCDRIAVMYLGKIVEIGTRAEVYGRAAHPYTAALLSAAPVPDPTAQSGRQRIVLEGDLPSPVDPPSGCRFRTRCWKATDLCATAEPALTAVDGAAESRDPHRVACHFPETAGRGVRGHGSPTAP